MGAQMPRSHSKLPTASVISEIEFSEPTGFWESIEQHTGKLANGQRKRLVEIIQDYYAGLQLEQNAPPVNDAMLRTEQIELLASAFKKAAAEPRDTQQTWDAVRHADFLINDALKQSRIRFYVGPVELDRIEGEKALRSTIKNGLRPATIPQISRVLTEAVAACAAASESSLKPRMQSILEVGRHGMPSWPTSTDFGPR